MYTLLIKLGSTSSITTDATFERWSDVAKKTQTLVTNLQEELAFAENPKRKKDQSLLHMIIVLNAS